MPTTPPFWQQRRVSKKWRAAWRARCRCILPGGSPAGKGKQRGPALLEIALEPDDVKLILLVIAREARQTSVTGIQPGLLAASLLAMTDQSYVITR